MTSIITHYAASDSLAVDAWKYTVEGVCAMENPDNLQEVAAGLLAWESGYKEETGATSCPTSWRSAKSVILAAIKAGISLVDADGNAVGKTAIGNMTKERVADSTISPLVKAQQMLATLKAYCEKHSIDFNSL
jgi:hypothetical protein